LNGWELLKYHKDPVTNPAIMVKPKGSLCIYRSLNSPIKPFVENFSYQQIKVRFKTTKKPKY
jgi:hypothetical protein